MPLSSPKPDNFAVELAQHAANDLSLLVAVVCALAISNRVAFGDGFSEHSANATNHLSHYTIKLDSTARVRTLAASNSWHEHLGSFKSTLEVIFVAAEPIAHELPISACAKICQQPDCAVHPCPADTRAFKSSDAATDHKSSNVTLRDGVVEAACVDDERCECYEPANGTTVRAMTPVDAVVPRVVFQGPASISVCDNFTLVADQSTGSAGREMMFFWSAAAAANSATLSAAVERAQGSAYFVLSYSELEEFIAVRSRLELTLSLTNFLEVDFSWTLFEALASNTSYVLRVTVIDQIISGLNTTQDVSIDVGVGQVVAAIDGAESYDEDDPVGTLAFRWQCVSEDTSLCDDDDDDDDVPVTSNPVLSLAAGSLVPGTYTFTVEISTEDGRTAEAQTILTVAATPIPRVDIAFFDAVVSAADKLTIEASVALTTEGAADAGQDVVSTWSLTSGDLAGDRSLENVARTPLSVSKGLDGNLSRSHPLVITPSALVPGGVYTFELDAIFEGNRGYASVSVVVVEPPTSGGLDVNPTTGFALYTIFRLLAEGWVSAEPPLQYRFETERGMLRTSSPDTVLDNTRFPIGFAPPILEVTVVVTDALRSTASASRNVNVTVFNTTLLVDDVNDALTTGFAKYSLSEVCQVVAATAGLLDDDNDDDDEVLATIVSALVSAVEEFVDPELEELELSIESSRALTENHLDDASAQEVLDVLNGLTSKLARIGLGVSGNTTAQDSVAEALSNLLTMGLFSTITEESESSRRRRQLEEGVSSSNLLLQTVDLLTLAQRETLVENEDAVGSRASNLRTASKIVSNQLTDGVQEVGIAGMNASSSIVPDDGSVYAISLTEFLVNPHEVEEEGDNNKALSQVVRFDLNVSSTISERFADDDGAALLNTANTRFTDVTLRIPGQVFLNRTPAIAVTAECECGFVGFKEVECPDATVSLFCDGLAPGVFNYTCNSTSLACATWDALTRRWVLPPSCETVQDEEDSTRCDCRVDNRDEPRDYSTRREVSNSAEEFTRVFETKPNIHKSRLVLAMCLGLVVATIVAAVLGEQLDRRGSEGKEDRDVRGSEEFSMRTRSTSFSFFNTPATRALARRQIEHVPGLSAGGVIESLRKHHPMLNWYYVYDAEMPRKWRALKLGVESALIFLALALEVAWIEFPSINCGAYDETKCEVEAKSLVSRKPLCKFDECSASCVEKSTTEAAATVEHFVLLALVVAVILPLLTFLDWLIDGIIAAPVPPALMPAWLCCESSSSSSSWPHFSPSSIAGGGPPAHETSDDAAQKTVRDESPDDDDDDDDSVLQVLNNEEDAPPPPPPPPQVKVEATFEEEEEEVTAADHSGEGGSRAPREHVAIAWGDNLAATIRQVQDDDFDLDECFVSTVDDDDDNNGSKMLVVFDDAKNNNSPEEEEEEDGAKDELPRRSGDSTIIDKEDDERPRPSSTLIALPSGGPPDSIWPQFIARCHASLGSRRSGAGLTSVERKKNDERTSGKSFGSRASRRVSFGLESLWNRSLAGSQPQQNNTEEVDMRGLAAEVVQNMRLGFLELETCRSYAESNEHVREVAMISEIEERFRREWHWVRDEDAWRANVLEMVRGHVQAAWRLWNDMENIRGDNASEALERMVDVERASRLSFVERRIYDTIRRQNQKPSPSPAAYVSAWLGLLVIMVGAVIVMMQVATSIGYDRTRLWVMGVLVDFVLIFVVLIPLGILIFDVALPLLIADRLRLLDDPTAIRTFPFKANVPSSPIFFFCQLEPAYAATRLGRFALGRVARKSRDSYRLSGVGDLDFDDAFLFDELPGIYEDMTWSPSPTVRAALRLCVGIIALPDGLRKPVFEELVLWFATLGTVAVSILLRRATLRYQDRFGELYFLLVAILSAVLGVLLGRIFVRFRAVLHGITTTTASTSFIT
ncbi:hypothetical protein CTAYLR_006198 [Chrysophaeum taylorii]|uniref:PKD/REJ-like domain-containing protein n=1 Tax=Chrysophaeum taylorii TaxID=2483200 RepID=A0AAD7UMP1_9STRA|nr:hypothetical protein CTAYLR_006198 [Chrysophaeum taylorii]